MLMFFRLWYLFKVNYNGFPVEIPGTVDIDQHGHIFGACLKSHEDTLSCNDVLHGISMAACASSNDTYTNKPVRDIFYHAWAFYDSSSSFMRNASDATHNQGWITWLQSSDDEDVDLPLTSIHNTHKENQISDCTYSAIDTCYAHFMSDIEKHGNLMVDIHICVPFKNDLRRLHDIVSPLVARIARQLL